MAMHNRVVSVFVASALVLVAEGARAGGSGTSDVACGSSSVAWNAPNGALVMSTSQGPVNGTLQGVGEYRTHSMISHGNGWVTHATMYSPGQTGWPDYCSTPLVASDLRNGFPGASQVQQGGIYTFFYGGGGSADYIGYQRGCNSAACPNDDGAAVADWLWNAMPYQWAASHQDASQGLYRLLVGPDAALTNYSLYQYRAIESVNTGGVAWNDGVVCSTLISYAHYMAQKGTVATYTYGHDQVLSALSGLIGAVSQECNDGLGFWKNVAVNITCLEGICDDAARQVANCMSVGRCDTDDDGPNNTFASVRDDPTSTATSISPDTLGGWSGHAWDGYLDGSGVSVWAADNDQTLQWNSSGNVYGCWF
jgi:hypothetical protein